MQRDNSHKNDLNSSLSIDQFREMDRIAIEQYRLPIELMMENAGLQLARFIGSKTSVDQDIMIGVGTGNNGGGGLVAARRLAAWGYQVYLDIPDRSLKALPSIQLKRARAFGVQTKLATNPALFVDAYFGFSQRLPLPGAINQAIARANQLECIKISLDLPSGFNRESGEALFHPDVILTLAAPKKELTELHWKPVLLVADIGIPAAPYRHFGMSPPPFHKRGYVSLSNNL